MISLFFFAGAGRYHRRVKEEIPPKFPSRTITFSRSRHHRISLCALHEHKVVGPNARVYQRYGVLKSSPGLCSVGYKCVG